MLNKLHLNNVHCTQGGMYITGLKTGGMLIFNGREIRMAAELPPGTHNAQPFRDGVLFNDTEADLLRYAGREAAKIVRCACRATPTINSSTVSSIRADRAPGLRARARCALGQRSGGRLVAIHVSVYDLAKNERVLSVNLTMDVQERHPRPRGLALRLAPGVAHAFGQLRNDVCQVFLPRAEVLFVAPPGAERARVERLAHLLRARRPYRAMGLVESQAGFFERQAAVREDAPDLRLEISDRFLVVHVEHLARQYAMPVAHDLVVLPVVHHELVHVVGEVLPLAEELLVAAEDAVERMAPRVDDLRVRQDQVQRSRRARSCSAACR